MYYDIGLGQVIESGGQSFECVGFKPYVRADGSETELVIMQAKCAKCGLPFRFTVPQGKMSFHPNRRCAKHRSTGVRVAKKKGRLARAPR